MSGQGQKKKKKKKKLQPKRYVIVPSIANDDWGCLHFFQINMGYKFVSYLVALSGILCLGCLNNTENFVRADGEDNYDDGLGDDDFSAELSEISTECAQKCERCYPSSDLLGRTACGQKCDLEGAGVFTCSIQGKESF